MSLPDPKDALAAIDRQSQDGEQDELPPTTTLEIDVRDGRGKQYTGRFMFTVPTLGDQIRIGKVKSVYLPGGTADPASATLVDMLGFLSVTCSVVEGETSPPWFDKALALRDATPLDALYRKALDYERRFLGGDKDGGSAADTTTQPDIPGGTDQAHVGRKVQPPAQRRETLTGDA